MGINQFCDMSNEEFAKTHFGLLNPTVAEDKNLKGSV